MDIVQQLEMAVQQPPRWLIILILVIICLVVFVYLLDKTFGIGLVRRLVCGMLFWVPFGSSFTALTSGCAAIPA